VSDVILFDRQCRLVIGAPLAEDYKSLAAQIVEIDGLRTQFKIEKTLDKSPNTAEITVTNMAARTRSSLQAKGSKIILSAGYNSTLAQIFVGDARLIDHVRNGTDWDTKIQAGDGERAYLNGRVSESFAGGVRVPTIVSKVSKFIGLDASDAASKLNELQGAQFVNGYVAYGRASAELDKLLRARGYTWSIQDGRLQILKPGESATERVVSLSSDSGLIGSPEHGTADKKDAPAVLKFKALLSPEIRPGGRVDFQSAKHKGLYRVLRVTHTGDTAGGDWYTEGEAEPVKA
jgi:hypothetical protein